MVDNFLCQPHLCLRFSAGPRRERLGEGQGLFTWRASPLASSYLSPAPIFTLTWPCHRRHCPVQEAAGWPLHPHSAQLPSGLTSHLQPPGHQRDRLGLGWCPRWGSSTLGQVREDSPGRDREQRATVRVGQERGFEGSGWVRRK